LAARPPFGATEELAPPEEEEGGYVVTFPAIPDLATQGETLEEAREMAQDALRCYLEALQKDGEAHTDRQTPARRVPYRYGSAT